MSFDTEGLADELDDTVTVAIPDDPAASPYPMQETGYGNTKRVAVRDWEYTMPGDDDRILATDRLHTCIGILAYDEERKTAFLSHSIHGDEDGSMNRHIESFYDAVVDSAELELDVTYIIGNTPSYRTIKKARETFGSLEGTGFEVSNETVLFGGSPASVSFDARTGELKGYDRALDPTYVSISPSYSHAFCEQLLEG